MQWLTAGKGIVHCEMFPLTHIAQANPLELENGSEVSEMLVLQGKPIGEPVAQHGPFLMNTQAEVQQTFADYRRTQFGGWSWAGADLVYPRGKGRFAQHADGRVEERP